MPQYTDATLDEILLRVYSKGNVTQLQNIESPIMGDIAAATDYTIGGDDFRFGVNVEGDEQYGFIFEDGGLPDPDVEDVKQAALTPKVFVGQIKFTGLSRAISSRSEHAFVNAIQYAADQKLQRMTAYREGCLFRSGTGLLSLVNGAVAGATNVNVDGGNVMWFRPGMKITVINGSNVVQSAVGGDTIAEVDFENQRIIMASNVTYDDNASIFPSILGQTSATAPSERETFGLDYFLKTSGTTLGLSLSTYPTMKGNVVPASGGDVTEDFLLQSENRVMIVGGMSNSQVRDFRLAWHPNQRRKYFRLVQAQKQYVNLNLDAGYRRLTWNDHEAMETYNCPETTIYGGTWSSLEHFVAPGGEMQLDTTFGPVIKWQQGHDAGVMYYRCYDNYAVRKPNGMFALSGPRQRGEPLGRHHGRSCTQRGGRVRGSRPRPVQGRPRGRDRHPRRRFGHGVGSALGRWLHRHPRRVGAGEGCHRPGGEPPGQRPRVGRRRGDEPRRPRHRGDRRRGALAPRHRPQVVA